MPGRFRVGTSGWSYDHWREIFYPSRLPSRERLGFYVDHFDTVEVNASFYRLPSEETLRNNDTGGQAVRNARDLAMGVGGDAPRR